MRLKTRVSAFLCTAGLSALGAACFTTHALGSVPVPVIPQNLRLASVTADAGAFGGVSAPAYTYLSNADPRTLYAAPSISVETVGDFDSLVPSLLQNRNWQLGGSNSCSQSSQVFQYAINPNAVSVDGGAYRGGIETNPLGYTSNIAPFNSVFSLPPGANGASFTSSPIIAGALESGGAINFQIMDVNCASPIQSQSQVLTPSSTPQAVNLAMTADGGYYQAVVQSWTSGQDALIGTVQVKPNGIASDGGLFGNDFWRIGADSRVLWYNTHDGTQGSSYVLPQAVFQSSPQVELNIDTDATTMVLEVAYNDTNVPIGQIANVVVYVNHNYLTSVNPTVVNVGNYMTVQLPSGMKNVTIVSGWTEVSAQGFQTWMGEYLRAVYVPANATSRVNLMPRRTRNLIVYGDSIVEGGAGPDGGATMSYNVIEQLRENFNGAVWSEAVTGRDLYQDLGNQDAGTAINVGNATTLMNQFAGASPTDIWVQIGRNDWANASLTAANYQVFYGEFLDMMHARFPGAAIYAQTCTLSPSEGTTNGNGETIIQFRTAQTNACNARSWCTLVNGLTLFPNESLALFDPVGHLNPAGMTQFSIGILKSLTGGSLPATPNPLTWASQFPAGITNTGQILNLGDTVSDGGRFGNVTISGTCTGAGCGITNPYLGTLIADAGNFAGLVADAGFFVSLQENSPTTSLPLKGTAAVGGVGLTLDNTTDVTGTGYAAGFFGGSGSDQFAITGRGHLIPLSAAPSAGTLNAGLGTVTFLSVTGSDASCRINFTTGTATAIAAGGVIMIVTLNQAYSAAATSNAFAAFENAPGAAVSEVPLTAVFSNSNQVSIYSTTGAWTPATGTTYSIGLTTIGAGATN